MRKGAADRASVCISPFERTGDPADLKDAIAVAEDALQESATIPGDSNRRAILFPLSNALASRAALRHQQRIVSPDGPSAAMPARDATKAVTLARRVVETAGPAAHEKALAANAPGFALRVLGQPPPASSVRLRQ